MEIKEKLVALRKEKGLTQLAVAEKLNVSRQAISRWESGIALPSTDNLKSLSALYGVPIDYLLNSDVERERDQVQTDMHCGEQAIPQRKDKRKRVKCHKRDRLLGISVCATFCAMDFKVNTLYKTLSIS